MKFSVFIAALLLASSASFAQQNTSNDTLARKVIRLDEVEVNATKTNTKLKDLTNKVEVVSATTIKTSSAKDLGELLKINSSVDIIQYPGLLSSVGMRGFAPTTNNKYNALLINGLPAGTKNISTLGLSNIEQVEILKGPFSSLYGSNAMAGVINIVTPRHKDVVCGASSISLSSYMTSHADVSVGGKLIGLLSFDLTAFSDNEGADYKIGKHNLLKMSETDKAILDKNSYGSSFKNTKYNQQGATFRLGYDVNKNLEINVFQEIYQAKDVLSHGSIWGIYGNNKKNITRWSGHVEVEGKIKNHIIKFSPYYSNDLNDNYYNLADTTFISYQGRFINLGAQLQDKISIGNQRIVVGIDNNTQSNKTKRWASESSEIAPYNPDYQNMTTGAFAQTYLKFLDGKLNLSAGARYDFIRFTLNKNEKLGNEEKSEDYHIVNPNVGAKYELVKGLAVHSSWGTAFYAPDANQKAGNYTYNGTKYVANPKLKAETSQTYDAGVGYKSYLLGIETDVTYFKTDHKNLITNSNVNPDGKVKSGDEYTTYINAQKAKMEGLEILGAYDFGALCKYKFSLKAYVNATFMLRTRVKATTTWDDMKYVRKQNVNFGLDFASTHGFRAKFNGRYIGSRIEDNWFSYYSTVRPSLPVLVAQTQKKYADKGLIKHPDFLVFDMSAFYDFSKNLSVGLTCANLLDENYTEKDGYNMSGRNITAKCIIKF